MIDSILLCLAVYRLSHAITMEDGPFDCFAWLRENIGQATWVGRGMHCPLCVSFWLSLVVMWLPSWGVSWFGVAGAVMVLHMVLYRGRA